MAGAIEKRQIIVDDLLGDGPKLATSDASWTKGNQVYFGNAGVLTDGGVSGGGISINGDATISVNGVAISFDDVVLVNGSQPSDPGSVTSGSGPTPGAGAGSGSSGGTPSGGGSGGGSVPGTATSLAAQLSGDMGNNEGIPEGVPSGYDFHDHSYIIGGNSPGSNTAILAWGDVYVRDGGTGSTNTRIQIDQLRLSWMRASNGAWTDIVIPLAADGSSTGAYPEDFIGSDIPADVRSEGGRSISVIPDGAGGRNVHFYGPFPRIQIDRNDFGGVVVVYNFRLILDDPMGTDDRASAHFVCEAGADFYPAITGSGISNNPGVGGSEFKNATTTWRSVAFTTLTETQLTNNPPQISLTGISA